MTQPPTPDSPDAPKTPEEQPRYGVRLPPEQRPQPNPYGPASGGPTDGSPGQSAPWGTASQGGWGAGPGATQPGQPGGYQPGGYQQPGSYQGGYQQPGSYQGGYQQPGPYQGGYQQPDPYQSGPYQPSPYQSGPMAPGGSTRRNGLGVAALVLGVVSVVLFCMSWVGALIGVGAIITGGLSVGAAKRGEATNGKLGRTGLILGIIGVAVGFAMFLFIISTAGQEFLIDLQRQLENYN